MSTQTSENDLSWMKCTNFFPPSKKALKIPQRHISRQKEEGKKNPSESFQVNSNKRLGKCRSLTFLPFPSRKRIKKKVFYETCQKKDCRVKKGRWKKNGKENHNCTLSCLCDETEMMLKRFFLPCHSATFFLLSQFLSILIFRSNCQNKVDALHKLDHVEWCKFDIFTHRLIPLCHKLMIFLFFDRWTTQAGNEWDSSRRNSDPMNC